MSQEGGDKIKQLERRIQTDGWRPAAFLELAIVKKHQLVEAGTSEPQARIQIYSAAVKELERDERVYGGSQSLRATRVELEHSIRLANAGLPDGVDIDINGVNPALLDEAKAKELRLPDKESYLLLERKLAAMENLYGSHPERTNARIILGVKAKFTP